jgi:predicted DNA-binding transcriptional regulator AlpA
MMNWRLPELLEEARRKSGERLNLPQISEATGLSVSTVYMLIEH